MAEKNDLVWARDRATGEVGQHTEAFLAAWPTGYHRLTEAQAKASTTNKKSPARSTELEGGV